MPGQLSTTRWTSKPRSQACQSFWEGARSGRPGSRRPTNRQRRTAPRLSGTCQQQGCWSWHEVSVGVTAPCQQLAPAQPTSHDKRRQRKSCDSATSQRDHRGGKLTRREMATGLESGPPTSLDTIAVVETTASDNPPASPRQPSQRRRGKMVCTAAAHGTHNQTEFARMQATRLPTPADSKRPSRKPDRERRALQTQRSPRPVHPRQSARKANETTQPIRQDTSRALDSAKTHQNAARDTTRQRSENGRTHQHSMHSSV